MGTSDMMDYIIEEKSDLKKDQNSKIEIDNVENISLLKIESLNKLTAFKKRREVKRELKNVEKFDQVILQNS